MAISRTVPDLTGAEDRKMICRTTEQVAGTAAAWRGSGRPSVQWGPSRAPESVPDGTSRSRGTGSLPGLPERPVPAWSPGKVRRRGGPPGRLAWRLAGVLLCRVLLSHGVAASPDSPANTGPDLVFEAEFCRDLTFPWQPVPVAGASGGYALAVPEGAGSSEAFRPGEEGRVRFAVPATAGGDIELWLRVFWNGNCSNSLLARGRPGGQLATVTDNRMRAWHWVRVPEAALGASLAALELENREDGIWVDQLCLRPRGSSPPAGILPARSPWPPPDATLPCVSVCVAAAGPGVEALPPTEYLLHHTRELRRPMARQPLLVLFPGRETGLDVWLRWNHRQEGLPLIRLDGGDTVLVTPQPVEVIESGDAGLQRWPFAVRAHPDLPRGLTSLNCRVRTANGLEQVQPVRVLRPYRWLLSPPRRLNPAAGLDQTMAEDQALLRDPLGTARRQSWRAAEPGDFSPFGLLNLRRALSSRPFQQAYAVTEVNAASAGPATIDVTHDDWIRVWLNGTCVYGSEETAPSTLTRTRLPVVLRPGGNEVLVHSCQLKNYWEFSVLIEPAPDMPTGDGLEPVSAEAAAGADCGVLPPWSIESLADDLAGLVAEPPAGEAWRPVEALCRNAALTPVEPWWRVLPSLRHLLRRPADRRHAAEALGELRRRGEAADLPGAVRARLIGQICRERSALLAAALRPLEAAEEALAAVIWTDGRGEQQDLHAEVVRLLLSGDAAPEAWAYLDATGAAVQAEVSLRGLVALYSGDLEAAAACYGQPTPDSAGRHAGWLLQLGRAPEAEWLLRQVPALPPALRLTLAQACSEQQRFAECEALLTECLLAGEADRGTWERAAIELARFHAERASVQEAAARFRQELADLSHHAEDRRARILSVLARLAREAREPMATLHAAIAEADATGQAYRRSMRPLLDATGRRVGAGLLTERRYGELIELCNAIQCVSPGQGVPLAVWRFQALHGLGRSAAAEAVFARLRVAVETDPAQARPALDFIEVTSGTASAAERLAQAILDRHPGVPTLAADAALTLAYAAAALGRYEQAAGYLQHALAARGLPPQGADQARRLCRPWVVQSLRLAPDRREFGAVLLACPSAALRTAAAENAGEQEAAEERVPDEAPPSAAPPAGGPTAPPLPLAGRIVEAVSRALFGRVARAPLEAPPPPLPEAPAVAAPARWPYPVEPCQPPRCWITAPGTFPRCVTLDAAGEHTTFDDAILRAFGEPLPSGHGVVFLHGLVWVGTDRGVFCYHRDADRWARLHLPGEPDETPVTTLEARDGMLIVGWTSAAGQAVRRAFVPASAAWTTPPAP